MTNSDHPGSVAAGGTGVEPSAAELSMSQVPSAWIAAQAESSISRGSFVPGDSETQFEAQLGSRFGTQFATVQTGRAPIGHQSPFVANIAALGGAFVAGTMFGLAEILGIYRGPWGAVGVAVAIALLVRLSGYREPTYRAVISLAGYLLTMFGVLLLLTHRDLRTIYQDYSYELFEQSLIQSRVLGLDSIGAYLLGAVLTIQVAYYQGPTR